MQRHEGITILAGYIASSAFNSYANLNIKAISPGYLELNTFKT